MLEFVFLAGQRIGAIADLESVFRFPLKEWEATQTGENFRGESVIWG